MWIRRKQKAGRARKLSAEILEYLVFSVVVAAFTFLFLYAMGQSVSDVYLERNEIRLDGMMTAALHVWLRGVCIAAAVGVFLFLFLLLLGQRLSYLVRITAGVEKLREGAVDTVPAEGDDELTRLAEGINYFAAAERELKQRERESKEARENFIRSLSHDIRTPLTSMLSYTELLEKRQTVSEEELRGYMALVRAKTVQVRELMDQLLDGRRGTWEKVEDMTFLMRQFAAEWEEILEERFRCRIDLSACSMGAGMADLTSLRRIMDNLISNVEKYADPEKAVTLALESREDTLVIFQQNAVRTEPSPQAESRRIGLASIRETAQAWSGEVDAKEADGMFCVEITLKVPPVL